MKRIITIIVLCLFSATALLVGCKDEKTGSITNPTETMLAGTTTFQVDNTIQPIVEDVLAVFGSIYNKANITQINRSESDIVNALLRDSASVVILTRQLTESEEAHFLNKKIKPRVTPFAKDALALVTSKSSTDSIVNLEEVYKVMRGKVSTSVKQLVFDKPSSSTVRYIMQQAGVKQLPITGVYSLKSTEEVIKFVHDNTGAIGVIGVNWLVQPPQEVGKYVENIKVLGVNNTNDVKGAKKYYKPSQSDIATGLYPLTRTLYVLNYEGRDGLGTGFANYVSAPDGQRIILKSGLLPVTIPPREIEIVK